MNTCLVRKTKKSIFQYIFVWVLACSAFSLAATARAGVEGGKSSQAFLRAMSLGLLREDPDALENVPSNVIPALLEDFKVYSALVARVLRGNLGEAEESLRILRDRFPGSFFTEYGEVRIAYGYLQKGNVKKAREIMSMVRRAPLSFREAAIYLYTKGKLKLLEGQVKEGVRFLVSCAEKFPGTVESEKATDELMKVLLGSNVKSKYVSPKSVISFATALKGMGRFVEAERLLSSWIPHLRGKLRAEGELLLAEALRRQGRYTKAVRLLSSSVQGLPPKLQGEKLFYAGVFSWYGGRLREAIGYLERVVKDFPSTGISYRASYNLGRIFEEKGAYERAGDYYSRGMKSPEDNVALESAFRRGLMFFLSKRYRKAASFFRKMGSRFADEGAASRFRFFEGLSLERAGDEASARKIYEELVKDASGGLYFFQSLRKLNGTYRWDRFAELEFENLSPVSVSRSILEDGQLVKAPIGGSLRRAIAFQELGLSSFAMEEMRRVEKELVKGGGFTSPLVKYVFGDLRGAILMMVRGYRGEVGRVGRDYLIYPSSPFVRQKGEKMGDPFFLHAIIRQESLFDVYAVSPAGAVGLGQIMPGTARRIAKSLGFGKFSPGLLFAPGVNAAFASHHLGNLLRKYRGNRILAAAAYNGGEGAVRRWLEKFGKDPDLFPEMIGYEETRKYVRRVMFHYLNYLKLYGRGWRSLFGRLVASVPDE